MMSFRIAQHVALVAATITTGLIAGLFFAFACAVMPALGRSSDRTFVEAMQKINVAILNGWFMLCFLGSLFLGILAVVLHLRRDWRSALPWIIAGLVAGPLGEAARSGRPQPGGGIGGGRLAGRRRAGEDDPAVRRQRHLAPRQVHHTGEPVAGRERQHIRIRWQPTGRAVAEAGLG